MGTEEGPATDVGAEGAEAADGDDGDDGDGEGPADAADATPGWGLTGFDGGSSRKSPDPEVTVTDSEGTGSAGRLICEGRDRCDS
ncbi:hypothetical protein [Streptomyces sp.]|uniref:hypothetical protein n=1 Tax=Streptomyces sp. TaxID=1931 RepID=UPI002F3FEE73